jgi:hypothetical protein
MAELISAIAVAIQATILTPPDGRHHVEVKGRSCSAQLLPQRLFLVIGSRRNRAAPGNREPWSPGVRVAAAAGAPAAGLAGRRLAVAAPPAGRQMRAGRRGQPAGSRARSPGPARTQGLGAALGPAGSRARSPGPARTQGLGPAGARARSPGPARTEGLRAALGSRRCWGWLLPGSPPAGWTRRVQRAAGRSARARCWRAPWRHAPICPASPWPRPRSAPPFGCPAGRARARPTSARTARPAPRS